MLISVIVLTHNQIDLTKHCLSFPGTAGPGIELVLVDNGSTDGSTEFLSAHKDAIGDRAEVRIIFNAENLGGSRARNVGVAASRGDVLVFLDNDAFGCDSDWVFRLCAHLEDEGIGAVGPLLLFPDEDNHIVQSAGGGVTRRGRFGLLRRGEPSDGIVCGQLEERAWLPTAALACRRVNFEKAGGFDESLDPMSIGEDIDLCFKLREMGLKSVFDPSVRLFHFEGSTFNNSSFSNVKKDIFVKHSALLRTRWRRLFDRVPLATEEEVKYRLVEKDYIDPAHPHVSVRLDRDGSFADPKDGVRFMVPGLDTRELADVKTRCNRTGFGGV